ncbi:hypothetical protein BCR34DRAFT_227596 [Clohesyomyces aquaticus]|uniref:Uncharacterized protein n=1 Tax=Clohesyomyces aquaticus TaxID=1231657 RepID=A0A1Y1ZXK1_9PLEO|nr:hypothetical protein BCR34DRAFT_227596 [Clohesyomyces aquaticus]
MPSPSRVRYLRKTHDSAFVAHFPPSEIGSQSLALDFHVSTRRLRHLDLQVKGQSTFLSGIRTPSRDPTDSRTSTPHRNIPAAEPKAIKANISNLTFETPGCTTAPGAPATVELPAGVACPLPVLSFPVDVRFPLHRTNCQRLFGVQSIRSPTVCSCARQCK